MQGVNGPERWRVRCGFTLVELMLVVAIVMVLSAVAIPSFRDVAANQRLESAAWQMVQDLRLVRANAIQYQQDLNVYINYNNTPVDPHSSTNVNNRSYLFETFQWGMDQSSAQPDKHCVPGDPTGSHFLVRTVPNGVVIGSVSPVATIALSGKNYQVLCFRSGAGTTFRGEADIVSVLSARGNDSTTAIGSSGLDIVLQDPPTGRTYHVFISSTGKVSMGGTAGS